MKAIGFHVPTSMVQEFLEIVELNGMNYEMIPTNTACAAILVVLREDKVGEYEPSEEEEEAEFVQAFGEPPPDDPESN